MLTISTASPYLSLIVKQNNALMNADFGIYGMDRSIWENKAAMNLFDF